MRLVTVIVQMSKAGGLVPSLNWNHSPELRATDGDLCQGQTRPSGEFGDKIIDH
jgi:hypothetical protein